MALDEPKDTDEITQGDGYRLVVDQDLLERFGGLSVDFHDFGLGGGFAIRPGHASIGGCGPCSC